MDRPIGLQLLNPTHQSCRSRYKRRTSTGHALRGTLRQYACLLANKINPGAYDGRPLHVANEHAACDKAWPYSKKAGRTRKATVAIGKKLLGTTGLDCSPIALGTVKIGRNTDVKYPDAFSLPDDDSVISLFETAHNLGINLIDTAPAYGTSEARIGELLTGNREDWIICTKAGETYIDQTSQYDFSADAIEQSVTQSLARLRTDYLDIVLIHSDGNDTDIISNSDAVETLLSLKQRGAIRAIGMSTKTIEGGMAALAFSDVIMVTLNADDQSQLPVIQRASELGKGVLLKKVFASGYANPEESLRFALSQPGVNAAVVGTISQKHLRENVAVASATSV